MHLFLIHDVQIFKKIIYSPQRSITQVSKDQGDIVVRELSICSKYQELMNIPKEGIYEENRIKHI